MFKSLRKAASSLSRDVQSTFSSPSATHAAHVNSVLTFPNHTVRLGPVFAEGGFSYLHTATPHPSPSTPIRYAVKRLAYPSSDPDLRRQIDAEISLLSALPPHPNVVAFHGSTTTADTAFLLFDLIDGGTLPELLARTPRFPPDKLVAILSDVAAAIAHFHSQHPPISIRDVKLENILYDRLNHSFKLCDFGSASTFAGIHSNRQQILRAEEDVANSCTAMYRAPELVDLYSKQFICERVDVWALGCVWYALLYSALPFDGLSSLQITKGLQQLPPQPAHPPEFQTWLKAMLTVDPALRWDIFQVVQSARQWQRRPMDPAMSDAAKRLRLLRQGDFTQGSAKTPNATLPQPRADTRRAHDDDFFAIAGAQTRSSAIGQKDGNTSGMGNVDATQLDSVIGGVRASEGGCEAAVDGGWADFESAFGAAAPVHAGQARVTQNAEENMGAVQGDVGVPGGGGRAAVDCGLLIDFGDMSVGGVDAGGAAGTDSQVLGGQQSGGGAARERDLIDFG